jgi:hypothetical protein
VHLLVKRNFEGFSGYFAFDISQQIFSFVLIFFVVLWQWLLFLHQPCNSVHVRFVFVLLLILFQLLAYSFRGTLIYIRNLSVRYGLPVIVMCVYLARLKTISVSYLVPYQFPYCLRLAGGGDLCVVPSVLNWVNNPVTENGTEIGTILLIHYVYLVAHSNKKSSTDESTCWPIWEAKWLVNSYGNWSVFVQN